MIILSIVCATEPLIVNVFRALLSKHPQSKTGAGVFLFRRKEPLAQRIKLPAQGRTPAVVIGFYYGLAKVASDFYYRFTAAIL
jgi:hypothetical protein